ncbi:hypothetical protein COO60DRAFT_1699215 [Scenedesmus sp. NREL 46B-D3]|nr:hypothetical protein COO60DRAFT_1699215 [Scenedesmus sp. NREL 46B-D3]
MALTAGLNKPFAACPAARRRSVAAVSNTQRVVLPAVKAAAGDKSVNVPAAVSAFAASLVLLASPPAFAASRAEGTAGREETKALVDKGTPGAAKLDTMKTNVPFQAPGSNKSPRSADQDQGTTAGRILKTAGKQIGKNSQDPESAPFGVGRGPLVRSAQKMGQPGRLGRFGNEATDILKGGNTVGKQKEESGISEKVDRGYYGVYDKVAGKK